MKKYWKRWRRRKEWWVCIWKCDVVLAVTAPGQRVVAKHSGVIHSKQRMKEDVQSDCVDYLRGRLDIIGKHELDPMGKNKVDVLLAVRRPNIWEALAEPLPEKGI